jgi:hypothetical protein
MKIEVSENLSELIRLGRGNIQPRWPLLYQLLEAVDFDRNRFQVLLAVHTIATKNHDRPSF